MASIYNIPTLIKGDTFKDLQFTLSINSVAEDLTDYTIACKFRKNTKTGRIAKAIDTTAGITLVDAINGVFKIDAFTCDFDVATYYYDIEFTNGSGEIDTYIQGTFKVEQDVTY
jgi:hypothetical protein